MAITTTEEVARAKLTKMLDHLDRDQSAIGRFERYYDGQHDLKYATRKYLQAFGGLFSSFSDNWLGVIVDAATERMKIEGFRFPVVAQQEELDTDQATGDTLVWEMWQRNNLDLASEMAHETMFVAGRVYLMVGPGEGGSIEPVITVEHPSQVYVHHAANTLSPRVAAIKRWYDHDAQRVLATLYLPDSIWKFQASNETDSPAGTVDGWDQREMEDGTDPAIENPLGVIPVIPLYNRQQLLGRGKSEIEELIPVQNALNKTFNDAMLASEFSAFRQRLLIGMEVPEDEDGNVIPDFDLKAAVDRIQIIKDPNVKVQEFAAADLANYVALIVVCRDHMAARSRTPAHYLAGESNIAADALKASEAGLVAKVRRRSRFSGEGWEEGMRLACALKALQAPADEKARLEARAKFYAAETIWRNPETITDVQLADSLAKYSVLQVPRSVLWERLGASQTEIARWKQILAEEPQPLPETALTGLLRASSVEGQ